MRRTLVCLTSSAVLSAPALLAQDPVPEKVVSSRLGLDFTTQYFFRGMQQENQGIIAQPYVELGYGLYEGDGEFRSLDLKFGLWNSLHDGPTGGTGGIWYESNFYVALEARIGERMTGGLAYSVYHTPNGTPTFSRGAAPVEELIFTFDYDDRGQIFDSDFSGLQPSAVLAIEVDGQRDVPSGGHVGTYLGLGIEPAWIIGTLGSGDLTLSLPVVFGFSLGDYYERPQADGGNDDFFGYADFGAELSAPLTFLPSRMGPWTGHVGLHWLLLGDNNETRNDGDTTELVFSFGAQTYF